ncbi:type IV pilus biogenesis/stability protein PilW [Ningiella sp. W23]|uniref:type IV pilus biogenesis/stability protein PilW n=1 Tax=Ningiella sp. W23 TaxID=3023715 RepID=UPI003757BD6F
MLRVCICALIVAVISGCVSEPTDPSFIGARAFDPDEASKTRVSLGLTYLQNGNFSQAKFNLDKALEFAPRNGQAHYAMAFYYQQVEEPELAEESYEKALSFSRNDPDVVNSYGAFLCEQGKYEKAKEYFLAAVNDRNYVSTAETYENLAICSQSQGNNEEAIEFFNSALNHQPTRPKSLLLLANLYAEEEQWEEAKRALFKYERSAQVTPESLYLQYQIATGLNDTKTAVGYGEILKSMFPEHPKTKDYVAAMGKFKPAATITRKVRSQPSEDGLPDAELARNDMIENDTASAQSSLSTPQVSSNITDSGVSDIAESSSNSAEQSAQQVNETIVQASDELVNDVDDTMDSDAYHTVVKGDNLYRISLKYNVKMNALIEWNNLDDPAIQLGMVLRVKDPVDNE